MDPVKNPYAPGAGTRPPALTGRNAELEAFRTLLERLSAGRTSKSLMITGLRGVGKTVLLNTFRDLSHQAGFRTAETEITHETRFRPTLARMIRRVIVALDPLERAKDKALQAARVFKAFTLKLPGGFEIGVDVDAMLGAADSGNLSEDLGDLFVAIAEAAAERHTGVVLLFDEVQFLERADLEALIAATHRVSQRSLPLSVAGAGLPHLPRLAGEAKSYAERLFDFPFIDRLDRDAATEALVRPAREEGISFLPDATEAILDYTDGYPYFIQEYGLHVWNVAHGATIRGADVETARPIVQEQLDENFFRVRLERTTPTERTYLAAMAELGPGPYKTGEVAAKLGRESTHLAPIRANLINKGLVYSRAHGTMEFTVPQFDDFLRRRLAQFDNGEG